MKSILLSEASIAAVIATAYLKAGWMDRAEEYFKQALLLEPGSPIRMNDLAYFLINNKRDINQGMELMGKALELNPGYYNFLDTKGWGLYKQGKYRESLEILQKSRGLRREKPVYNQTAFLHLEAAKKAVAMQNND